MTPRETIPREACSAEVTNKQFAPAHPSPKAPSTPHPLEHPFYDNTSDPDEHLAKYVTWVNLFSSEHHPVTNILNLLEGVDPTLVHLIARQLNQLVHDVKTKGKNEPLRSFMAWFSNVAVKIHDLNPQAALHAMFMALKAGQFSDSLCREPPTTMDELRARVTDYI
ncbi:hypothetical protein CR513_34500, partial [Mucuna pruriens]